MIDIEEIIKDLRIFKSIGNARVKASQDLIDKAIKALEQQQAENKSTDMNWKKTVHEVYEKNIVIAKQQAENIKLAGIVEDLSLELGKQDDLIEQLKKDNEWISVEDGLPEHKVDAVFMIKFDNTDWFPCTGWCKHYDNGDILIVCPTNQGTKNRQVSKWKLLTLPKPPEGENSCNKSCSQSDWYKGGKCDINGCYKKPPEE